MPKVGTPPQKNRDDQRNNRRAARRHLYDYDVKKERDALIKAAPAEWDVYVTAFKAGYAARQAMWTAASEAQGALRNAAPDEWTEFDFARSQFIIDQGLGYLERLKAAETALKQAALSEDKELGMPVK